MATTITSPTAAATSASTISQATAASGTQIAQNFNQFLKLLTTQLQNQNPLDPLDTNQFTEQLVQFAQVEQQLNMNQSLGTLISLQSATQASAALGFLGADVVVNGATAHLAAGSATWGFSADKPATAVINVSDSNGAVVYSESRTIGSGQQSFTWNGNSSSGQPLPEGDYTISITAKDASGQISSIATDVEGTVDSVDLTKTPPVLSIGKRTFTIDKVKQVRRSGT